MAIARTGIVYRCLGWVAVLGGLGYAAIGIAVGYTGFEKPGTLAVQLLFLIFAVGVLVAGVRRKDIVEPGGA